MNWNRCWREHFYFIVVLDLLIKCCTKKSKYKRKHFWLSINYMHFYVKLHNTYLLLFWHIIFQLLLLRGLLVPFFHKSCILFEQSSPLEIFYPLPIFPIKVLILRQRPHNLLIRIYRSPPFLPSLYVDTIRQRIGSDFQAWKHPHEHSNSLMIW